MTTFIIKPGQLSLQDCRYIFENEVELTLDSYCFDAINRSAQTVTARGGERWDTSSLIDLLRNP